MKLNEPTRPDTSKKPEPAQFPSPVTFAPIGEGRTMPSPVTLFDAHTRATPVSTAEAAVAAAESEKPTPSVTTDRPVISVDESFLMSAAEFVLKMGHKDIPKGEAEFRVDMDTASAVAVLTVVNCYQLVAQDITDDQAKALGHENAEKLADDMGWYADDWGTQPVTVIQVARA